MTDTLPPTGTPPPLAPPPAPTAPPPPLTAPRPAPPAAVAPTPAPKELPAQFADLAPFTDWTFDTWRPRYEKRLASTMDEMQAFYDAVLPRMADIIDYANRFDLDELPDDVRNL